MKTIHEEYSKVGKFKYSLYSKNTTPSYFTPTNNLFIRFNKDLIKVKFKITKCGFVECILKKQGIRYIGCCLEHKNLIVAKVKKDSLSFMIYREQWELRNLILSGFLNEYSYNN